MLNNIGKMAISKHFTISLIFIVLMFTSMGLSVDDSYAIDANQSIDEFEMELDVEDKLENSQNDAEKLSSSESQEILGLSVEDNEILTAATTYTVSGGSFKKIQDAIDNAKSGDVIRLNGNFYSTGDEINLNKKLTLTSSSNAVLDGKDLSRILQISTNGAGSLISGLKFINGYSKYGGAIQVDAKDITIDNCIFDNNHVTNSAGAVRTAYNALDAERLTVKNCVFTRNSGGIGGGALGAYSNKSQVINCIFDSNHVESDEDCYGGAIQIGIDIYESYGSVRNCTFTNNWAETKSSEYVSHGGAGCIRKGSSYIDCTFINNTADHGGAITFHGIGDVDNCVFINNSANLYGGAISIDLLHDSMELEIKNSIFEGNEAPYGGAIRLSGMNIDIDNCNFDKNHASIDGGAININATTVNVYNSNFNENTADNDGGALYLIGKTTTVKSSTFTNNSAIPDLNKLDDGLGGAIYINSTYATIQNNLFNYNTARNGSAVYYDKNGKQLNLIGNTMFQNQAWVYHLPIFAKDIYYGETEEIKSIIYGGNNIAKYNNLAVSNAIYNAADFKNIKIDDETPISGATMSGELYQDDREYNMDILMTIVHEDGEVVYNKTLKSNYLGEVTDSLDNLKPGKYYVYANHFEDTYYKSISNSTTFNVVPKVDIAISKTVTPKSSYNFEDVVTWTLTIKNNGPNDATGVIVKDTLPEGLIWLDDDSKGKYDSKTGILNIGSLASGENFAVNIITCIDKTGSIINKANVSSNEYDIDLSNNYAEKEINVEPASDLQVIKSVNNTDPNYGDLVKWTISVKNNGPDTAHDVLARDIIPKSLILVSVDGDYNSQTGLWNIGTLEVGKEVKLIIITRIGQTGETKNDVSVSGREFDYDLSNNNDSQIIDVKKAADLAIEKSVNSSQVNYGGTVKWTLIVSNKGPDAASGVKLVDILPNGFIYMDSKISKGTFSNNEFNIGNLEVGEKVTAEIITKVNITGEFVNTATVSGNEFDLDLTNNVDDEKIKVNPACDLEVIKEVNETAPNFSDLVEWTITVKNNGPDTATNVVLNDVLSESLIWISDNSNGKFNPKTGVWSIGELKNQNSIILNIITKINSTGIIYNNVSVSAKEFDYNKSNNNDSEFVDVEKSADVYIIKTVNQTNPNYMDLVKWTLTVSNNGPDKATNVNVTEEIPEGLILIETIPTKGYYENGYWFVCCLENGEVETLELVSKVNKTGEIKNIVSISADEYDPNPTNNNDDEIINVPLAVDLEIIKTVDNQNHLFGENVTWRVVVTNHGPDGATDVVVNDLLDENLIFIDCVASKGSYSEGKWFVGTLANGDTETINITCLTNGLGTIINKVNVTSSQYDWNKSNNGDEEFVDVLPVADLSITKLVNVTYPNYGELVKWTLIITNDGPNTANDVVVRDVLPEQLLLIESSDDYDGEEWSVGILEVGETKKLEIISKVIATGLIDNFASIYATEFDPNLDNNYDEKSIDVPPASDLAITKTVSKYHYYVGDIIKYTIKLVNNGPDAAKNIIVDEILDENLKIKSFKISAGKFNKLTKTWSINSLDVDESAVLYLEVVAEAEGIFNNEVSVTSDSYDPDLTNNDDNVYVNVTEKPQNNNNDTIISKKPNLNTDDSFVKENTKLSINNLQKNVSGNPIVTLVVSLLFSLIFAGGNILNKR